jgi:hypothetical protein
MARRFSLKPPGRSGATALKPGDKARGGRPGTTTGKPGTGKPGAKPKAPRGERTKQLRTAFSLTRKRDRRLVPYMLLAFLVPVALAVLVGILTGHLIYLIVLGVLLGLTAAVFIFGRRASSAMFAQVEGQTGAGLAVLQSMRGDWRVTPVVAATAAQDMVHRVIGRPGVVLVGEGSARRLAPLLGQEKKRIGRLIGDTPVYDVMVGDEDGQVPIRKLQNHFVKLPRNITPKQVNALDTRLSALGGMKVPMPQGPMPKGARAARGAKMRPPR